MPPESKPFIPRASLTGAYFACDFRAGLDRARAEGILDYEIKDTLNPYAALGTVAHYALQTRLGCTFPEGTDCAPTAEEREMAAKLFGGGLDTMQSHADAIASLAAQHMPEQNDGPWLAEPAFEISNLTGHIDFLSPDNKIIVDLKTTQRKPDHNRIKPGHLYQLMAYRKLVETTTGVSPQKGYVLYVDAKAAKWALCLPFDFASKQARDLSAIVDQYLAYLLSPTLMKHAVPRLGNTCSGDYCPYVGMCRDQYIPAAGTPIVVGEIAGMPQSAEF